MRCPCCAAETLQETRANRNVLIDLCSQCHGVWLDRGKIYEFSQQPRELEKQLRQGLRDRRASTRLCPRCNEAMERGIMPDRDAEVEECPACGGFWFDHDQL